MFGCLLVEQETASGYLRHLHPPTPKKRVQYCSTRHTHTDSSERIGTVQGIFMHAPPNFTSFPANCWSALHHAMISWASISPTWGIYLGNRAKPCFIFLSVLGRWIPGPCLQRQPHPCVRAWWLAFTDVGLQVHYCLRIPWSGLSSKPLPLGRLQLKLIWFAASSGLTNCLPPFLHYLSSLGNHFFLWRT
jgi:hypothetical protein